MKRLSREREVFLKELALKALDYSPILADGEKVKIQTNIYSDNEKGEGKVVVNIFDVSKPIHEEIHYGYFKSILDAINHYWGVAVSKGKIVDYEGPEELVEVQECDSSVHDYGWCVRMPDGAYELKDYENNQKAEEAKEIFNASIKSLDKASKDYYLKLFNSFEEELLQFINRKEGELVA